MGQALRRLLGCYGGEVVSFPSGRRVVAGQLLAEGGFSFVHRAEDPGTGQQYALKKMLCQDSGGRAAASAEAEVHARFRHENLLELVDRAFQPHPSSRHVDVCWLLFPLCRGSLRSEITRRVLRDQPSEEWTPARVAALLAGVCSGLHEMHLQGIAHRDVKPENVLLRLESTPSCPFGVPVLMDFGSCGSTEVPIRGRQDALLEAERAATNCTMQYCAPELFDVPSGIGALSYASADVWALGCTWYCCLLGYSPFEVEFDHQPPCAPRQVDASHLRVLAGVPWPRAGPRSAFSAARKSAPYPQ
ncbi:unnamed protein product [Prorocentrum cordatum]|uniref:non-specific serine/threonine protein kinase n=1 Tax=Prorocentrum cordatum TaxID=2364126 RepID=A0ABN9PWZ3_9DINO|nr:unnamed protein product [Polarella glacialis]